MTDQSQKHKILRYGQIIRIQGTMQRDLKGLITAKGFTDLQVHFQIYDQFQTINNYRESLFQLLPRGSFEIHDEYLKMNSMQQSLEQLKKKSEKKSNDTLKQRLKTEKDQYFIMIQTKMNEEVLFGAEVIFKHIESDAYLVCSDQCSDYRTDSFKLELSDQFSSHMIFKIQPFHSFQQEGQSIHFDEPLRIQSEGQKFWIDCAQSQSVFIDEVIRQVTVNGIDNIGFEQFRPPMRRLSTGCQRYEAVISHNGKDSWKFKQHESYDQIQEKSKLKPYDLCIFNYTSNNAYLSVDMFTQRLQLKENKDSNNSYFSLDSVWEVQPIVPKQILEEQDNYNSMENLQKLKTSTLYQSEYFLKKSKVTPNQVQYILRHFLTGKVLTVNGFADKNETLESYIDDMNLRDMDQLFELKPAKQGQNVITHGTFIKILFAGKYELQQLATSPAGESKQLFLKLTKQRTLTAIESFFKKLQDQDLDHRTYSAGFTSAPSPDAFAIHKINDETKNDLLYVLSSQEWMIQFVDILKLTPKEVEKRFRTKVLNKIIYIIKGLLRFVLNISESDDAENSEALPLTRRQRTLKDLFLVEILIEIFFFISYKNGLESLFKHYKNEKEKIKSIFKLSYCLIGKIIKSNPQIKLHVSQWLELFLHQAMMIDDMNVQQSLAELLDDNYHAIQRFITRNSIKRIVEIMRTQMPHEKYLKILSSICVCKGKSIANNQNFCLNLFFQQIGFGILFEFIHPREHSEFRFQFKKDENHKILVLSHIQKSNLKWRTLWQFYNESVQLDEQQSWNYFISYFSLLSDVCMNRNRYSKKYVDENFPLDVLCCIIEDPESLKVNAIEPFLKCIKNTNKIILKLVIHFAYIDTFHYPQIRRIARVHEWKQISKHVDVIRTQSEDKYKPENCDVQRVIDILGKFLEEFQQLSVKDKAYSQNLYTVLIVLKTTIVLGFWKSISELQDVLQHLLRICSCLKEFSCMDESDDEQGFLKEQFYNKDIQESFKSNQMFNSQKIQQNEYYLKHKIKDNKERLTKMNLENLVLMKCKMLACDIIDLIFDLETNVRISKVTFVFKNLIDSTKPLIRASLASTTHLSSPIAPTNANKKTSQSSMKEIVQPMLSPGNRYGKNRMSFIHQMIEKTAPQSDVIDSPANLAVYKNMASMFRKGISEQDKLFYDVNKWMQEFRQLINDRNLFDSELLQKYNIELIFAELSLYENPDMAAFALSILNRIYGQRRELVQNFEKVIMVAEGQTYELSQESKVILGKLQTMADKNILNVDIQKESPVQIWREADNIKESGLIQDLNYLSLNLKRQHERSRRSSMVKTNLYDLIGVQNLMLLPYSERDLNSRLHQSLLKAQELHIPILQFTEFCIIEKDTDQIILKLLHQSYIFLSMLIWNHMDNKMELAKFKNQMYKHIPYNVGVIDFLKELFTNNKPLLFSEREIPIIINHVVSSCNSVPWDQIYKAKLLDFLRVLLVFNSKSIRSNQLIVLQKLQDQELSNILPIFDLDQYDDQPPSPKSLESFENSHESIIEIIKQVITLTQFEEWIDEYQNSYDLIGSSETHQIDINAQLSYTYTFFEIFSLLVEDQNEINIQKCKQMHPFQDLVQLISKSKSCWPIKRHLRGYINRLYYKQIDYENISQHFIETDIYNILFDLQEIIDIKTDPRLSLLSQTTIQNPIRFKYLISYVYLCLEEILISLNMVFNNEKFLLDLEEILTYNFNNHILQSHLQLFEIATKLSQIQYFYSQQKYISHFCKVLMNIFRSIFKTFDIALLLIREGLFNSALELTSVTEKFTIIQRKIEGDQIIEETTQVIERGSGPNDIIQQGRDSMPQDIDPEELKNRLIDNVFNFQYDKQMRDQPKKKRKIQASIVKLFQPKKTNEKLLAEDDMNELLNHKHKRLMNILNLSSQFQQFIDEEFIEVCYKMANIGKESIRIYNQTFEVTSLREFITNIIQMNINNPGFLRDDLRVFFLKMLTRLISEKNLKNKELMLPIDQWTSDYWSAYKEEITQAQNFLNECGASELIYQIFRESQLELRLNLTTECLGFAIAYLLGGNTNSQNSFLQRLKQDTSNTVLNNFAIIIRKISRVIYNNFQIKVEKDSEHQLFQVQTIDNFDYYDTSSEMMKRYNVIEPDDAKETAFKKQCLDLLCRFFRVLQLMCENNNVELKRFLRQQIDEDESIKLNSINFIEFTTTQLRLFLKILSKAVIQIPSFILDFLIEIIQLPCIENQITLCKTTFFEDASYMSQYFSNKQNQINRLFESAEDVQELQDLQNKILLAVLSVLEGNEDKIYQDLQNKLERQVLIDFFKSNLEMLNVRTRGDMEKQNKIK